eukprot:364344-Chlamydomonas_euryale.AAC.4
MQVPHANACPCNQHPCKPHMQTHARATSMHASPTRKRMSMQPASMQAPHANACPCNQRPCKPHMQTHARATSVHASPTRKRMPMHAPGSNPASTALSTRRPSAPAQQATQRARSRLRRCRGWQRRGRDLWGMMCHEVRHELRR